MDKQLDENKIENQVYKNGDVLTSFGDFKEYLSGKVSLGKKLGMDEEQLANSAQKLADYLASQEPPRNSEEHLLQELWKVGTEEEQHTLSHMLVRLVQQ
jgi:DNA-binding response OmpR family regulator